MCLLLVLTVNAKKTPSNYSATGLLVLQIFFFFKILPLKVKLLTFNQQVEKFVKLENNDVMSLFFKPIKLTFCYEFVT